MDIVTSRKLSILIQLAEVDKHFDSSERDLIFRIAKELHFSEEAVAELIRNPLSVESLGALSEEQKLDYLFSCLELIFVDKKILKSEILFMKGIALKLGFRAAVVDFLIAAFENTDPKELKRKVLADFLSL